MAKRTILPLSFFVIISILSFRSNAQVSYGGEPASFNRLKSQSLEIPVVDMAPVNNYELQLKDLQVQAKNEFKKYRFAKSFDVDISPDNAGVWNTADGMRIWRVAIRSKSAYSLNILFDRAILPTGASIFIYSPDHRILRGAFTANNEQTSGVLPIFPLPGDEIIVEYDEPATVSVRGEIHISKVNHDYKNAIGSRPLGESGTCNMDVYCKEATVLNKEKQAVVQLVISGIDLCTGTLINNIKRDKTPYLLTAGHCIQSAADAQQTVLTFNYESPYCGQNGSANGYVDQTLTGTILRARSDSLDFALVELEMMPPPEYRPYYAGWDLNKTAPATARSVHHPKGDVKKVSVCTTQPGIASYGPSGYLQNSFWWIKKWDIGTTEAGSSGGPLFNSQNLMIGTLTGGTATCDRSIDDFFSMLAYQWNYFSSTSRQLKRWLDPANTGATSVEALDPYQSPAACDQFSDLVPGDKYITAKLNNGYGYVSGHNSMRITRYAQEFNTTEKTTLSAFSASFSKATTGVNNSNSIVVFRIYQVDEHTGMPGTVLKSFNVPILSLKIRTANFFQLDQPLTVTGKYFIGYDINYSNISDTVAVYHAPSRAANDQNRAYCVTNNAWQPFYWVPEINLKTSLLINAFGCATTLAQPVTDPVPNGNAQFKVYYPTDPSSNLLYLVNTGKEEFGRIIFYDLQGRKISEIQRMLTREPMAFDCNQVESAIYCMAVQTLSNREVMKVRIIRTR